MMAIRLSADEVAELLAIQRTTKALKAPSIQHKSNWFDVSGALARKKLVTWKPHPTMGPDFREISLTKIGAAFISVAVLEVA